MHDKVVSVYYDNEKQFQALAANFKIMQDLKEGIPRTAYRGVVKFHAQGNVVFLRPRTLPPPLKM